MPIDTKLGYVKYDKDQLLDQVKQYFITNFGSDINLDDGSNAGAIANILAEVEDTIDSIGQGIRDSGLLLKSTGQAIDDIGANEGIYRKIATNSSVTLLITAYINPNSPVIIDTDNGEYSTADGQIFRITDDVTISQQATTSNGQPMVDDDGNPLGQVSVTAVSEDTGVSQNVAPNSIVNAEQSVDGFYSVTNPDKAQGGIDVETDDKLKARIMANRQAKPNGTQDGLTTAIKNIPDVKDARVVTNTSNQADAFGNPAYSIHAYVLGGQPNEIAQAIYDNAALDTNFAGSKSGNATDVSGKQYSIAYDAAPQALIYIKVAVKADATSFNNDYGIQQIKDSINQYFDGLSMGDSVNFTKLFSPIYAVSGVNDAEISMGRDSASNVQPNQSITVNNMEVPVVANIDVEVN